MAAALTIETMPAQGNLIAMKSTFNHVSRTLWDTARFVSRCARDAYRLWRKRRVAGAIRPQAKSGAMQIVARDEPVPAELASALRKRDFERSLVRAGWTRQQAKAEVARAFQD